MTKLETLTVYAAARTRYTTSGGTRDLDAEDVARTAYAAAGGDADTIDADADELDERLRYLDALRESGAVNMFGAGPVLAEAFGLDAADARAITSHWMKTFGERKGRS